MNNASAQNRGLALPSVQNLKDFLSRSRLRASQFSQVGDSSLQSIIDLSADQVSDLLCNELHDTGAKVIAANNSRLNEAILIMAVHSLESANPYVSETSNVEPFQSTKSAMDNFKLSAVYTKVQNLISQSGLRDVSNWID